jgi:hypothetical protein
LVVILCVALTPYASGAEERHPISYKNDAANSSYPQQFAIDVGDVPGHQVRVFETRTSYTASPPVFDGVKAVEHRGHGTSDYTNGTGSFLAYYTYVLEDGNKVFGRVTGTVHTTVQPDGSKQTHSMAVVTLTGGTGRFHAIRGIFRQTGRLDPSVGRVGTEVTGEYWFNE